MPGPAVAPRMTEHLLPPVMQELLAPETVVSAAIFLVSDAAPDGAILCAGGGLVSRVRISETAGIAFAADDLSAERVAASFGRISDDAGMQVYTDGPAQFMAQVNKAAQLNGVSLGKSQATLSPGICHAEAGMVGRGKIVRLAARNGKPAQVPYLERNATAPRRSLCGVTLSSRQTEETWSVHSTTRRDA